MNRRWILGVAFIVAIAQIAFLYSMIEQRSSILRNGQEIFLSVEPVDPRDLLRGDYVVLRYNISFIPSTFFQNEPETGDDNAEYQDVFVRLRSDDNGIWQPVSARFGQKPQPAANQSEVDIRGNARMTWFGDDTSLNVSYGLERFYVPEGEGREIERNIGQRQFRVKVAVADNGSAQIKALYEGDRVLYEEPLY
jgi:uncharacterized membrane-anchored protein